MSPLLREAWVGPGSALREAWLAVRGRRMAQALFVQPGAVWSYALEAPHDAVRHDHLAAWCAAHPHSQAHLVLSGLATHDLVVQDPTLPLHDAAAVAAWAAHQFVHYHGNAAQHWPVAPWMAGGRCGATAIHGVDLAALQLAAAAQAVRLRAVRSWWAVALAAVTQQVPALASAVALQVLLVESTLLTQVSCSGGAVRDVQQRWLDSPTVPALHTLLQELVPAEGASAALLLGYGLEEATPAALQALPARVLGALNGDCPALQWVAP